MLIPILLIKMKIGIDLNDVLRCYIQQVEYVYNKYKIGEEIDIEKTPIKDFDIIKYFPFEGGINTMNKFLYEEAALEVFGHADETHSNITNRLNLYYIDLVDDQEHELVLVSREAINSIPATYFFLSKTGNRIPNIKFSTKYEDMWDGIDILITANPLLIESKPEDKKVVKIKTTYNDNTKGNVEYETLIDFFNDKKVLENINNITDINFKEI